MKTTMQVPESILKSRWLALTPQIGGFERRIEKHRCESVRILSKVIKPRLTD